MLKRFCLALLLAVSAATIAGAIGIEDVDAIIRQRFGAPVNARGATDGQVLTYDSSTGRWVAEDGGAGSTDFADDVFRVSDNGDATKKIAFQVSGISTGTVRTLTVPDSNGTLVTTAAADIADTIFRVVDDGDATKKVAFQVSGITTGTTRTLTVPNSDGTLITSAAADIADNVARVVGSADATKKLAFEVDGFTTGTTRTITVPNVSATMHTSGAQNTFATGLGAITQLLGPTDQPLKITAGSTSGTNQAGLNTVLGAGLGTGTGTPGHFVITSGFKGSTGTTQHAETQRIFVSALPKALTDNVAATYANVPVATAGHLNLTVHYGVRISDGTDHQAVTGIYHVSATNKAGTVTTSVRIETAAIHSPVGTVSGVTPAAAANGASVDLRLTIDTSLTPTTFDMSYTIIANSPGVTVTPQ